MFHNHLVYDFSSNIIFAMIYIKFKHIYNSLYILYNGCMQCVVHLLGSLEMLVISIIMHYDVCLQWSQG